MIYFSKFINILLLWHLYITNAQICIGQQRRKNGNEEEIFSNYESEFQTIQIVESKQDKCLLLDGIFQICDSYNDIYSETYVHLAVGFLNQLKKVLIIGGGDALALNEVLKYKNVEKIIQLELDPQVPAICQKHFNINAHLGDKNSDSRVKWIFGDAFKTLETLIDIGENDFDLVIMDISETAVSNSVSSFNFFSRINRILKNDGILIKNENYQMKVGSIFKEYLEIFIKNVPVILEQTFVLGSNGTNLYVPNFNLFFENNIQHKSLYINGSIDQVQSLIKRYSKNLGITKISTNQINQESKDTCESKIKELPCFQEYLNDNHTINQKNWRSEACGLMPKKYEMEISITNNSPNLIQLNWISPVQNRDQIIVNEILPGHVHHLLTYEGHKFEIMDPEIETGATLAKFEILPQLITHPHIEFFGIQNGLYAVQSEHPCNL